MLRLLCLLALVTTAGACGSGEGPALEGDPQTDEVDGAAGGDQGLVLTVDPAGELVGGGPVTWRLTVTNGSDEDVTLAFSSGQQGDVVLTGDAGAEAYRWSDGMLFSQALTEVPVPAGGEITFELPGELDVEPGSYLLLASVPSDPAPEAVARPVTVTDRLTVPRRSTVSNMKTTIDVAPSLLDAARREAARRGTTLRALVEEGLSLVLADPSDRAGGFELADASVGGTGLRDDLEGATWEDLRALAYEGRGG